MEEVQIPSPAAVSDFRSRRLLEGLNARVERGRLDLYKNLLSEVIAAAQAESETARLAREEAELALEEAKENNDLEAFTAAEAALADIPPVKEVTLLDIAAALMAQAVGDEGPAPRVEKDRRGNGKTRREETLDENGEFASAVFEGGRDKGAKGDKPRGERGDRPRGDRGGRASRAPFGRRYRIEVGKKDGVGPGSIVGAITGEGGIHGKDLGRIEIFPTFSLVEINADMDDHTMARIGKAHVQGRPLRIREDHGAPEGRKDRGDRGDRPRFADRGDRGDRRDRNDRREERYSREFGGHERGDRPRFADRGDRRDDRGFDGSERRFGGARGSHRGAKHAGKHGGKHGSKHTTSAIARHGRDRDFGGREHGGRDFGGRGRRY